MSKELVKSKQYGAVSMGGYGKPYRPKSEASKSDSRDLPAVDDTAMQQAKEISKSRGMGEGAARYQYKRLQLAQSMAESASAGKNAKAGHKMLDSHYKNLARVFNVNTFKAMYGLQDNGDDNMKVKFEKRMPHKMSKGDIVCLNDNIIGELQDSVIMGPNTRMVFQDRSFMAESFSNDFSVMLEEAVAASSAQGPATFKEDIEELQDNWERSNSNMLSGTNKNTSDNKMRGSNVSFTGSNKEGFDNKNPFGPNNMSVNNPGKTPSVEFSRFSRGIMDKHKLGEGSMVKFENKKQGTSFYGGVSSKGNLRPLAMPKDKSTNGDYKFHHDTRFKEGAVSTHNFDQPGHPMHGTKYTIANSKNTAKSISTENRKGSINHPDIHEAMMNNYNKSIEHVTKPGVKTDTRAYGTHMENINNYRGFSEKFGNGKKLGGPLTTISSPTTRPHDDNIKNISTTMDYVKESKNVVASPNKLGKTESNPLTKRIMEAHSPKNTSNKYPSSGAIGSNDKTYKAKLNTAKGVSPPGDSREARGQRSVNNFMKKTEGEGVGRTDKASAINAHEGKGSLHGSTMSLNVHDKNGNFKNKFVGSHDNFHNTVMNANKYAEEKGYSLSNSTIEASGKLGSNTSNKGNDPRYDNSLSMGNHAKSKVEVKRKQFTNKGNANTYKVPMGDHLTNSKGKETSRPVDTAKFGPSSRRPGSLTDYSKGGTSNSTVIWGNGLGHDTVKSVRNQNSYVNSTNAKQEMTVKSGSNISSAKKTLDTKRNLPTDKEFRNKNLDKVDSVASPKVGDKPVGKDADIHKQINGFTKGYKDFKKKTK